MYQFNQEAEIYDYVNRTFAMYDRDHSNTLDMNEFIAYMNDWYHNMGYNAYISPQEAQNLMMQIDKNYDGHITRE